MNIKKILIILVVCLVGVFVSNVSLKAHNNMDNSSQVIPSTDMLIGDIYIPRLFEFTYDEITVSFNEYYQGGLPDSVDYSYDYNGINYVGEVPFFTENGAQLFTQYASSFRFVADVRVIYLANNIDYTTKVAVFLPYLKYLNDYSSLYDVFMYSINKEYIYYSINNFIVSFYVLDNDNRSYEVDLNLLLMFLIGSDGDFDSDEVQLKSLIEIEYFIQSLSPDADIQITDLYVDFYVPNVMLAKDFGDLKFNDGFADGYNDGFADGASGEDGVFSSIGNFLTTSVGGFLNFELFPGFSIMAIFGIIIGLILLIIILKMFMGG